MFHSSGLFEQFCWRTLSMKCIEMCLFYFIFSQLDCNSPWVSQSFHHSSHSDRLIETTKRSDRWPSPPFPLPGSGPWGISATGSGKTLAYLLPSLSAPDRGWGFFPKESWGFLLPFFGGDSLVKTGKTWKNQQIQVHQTWVEKLMDLLWWIWVKLCTESAKSKYFPGWFTLSKFNMEPENGTLE